MKKKNESKRIIAALLFLVLVLSGITGCGKSAAETSADSEKEDRIYQVSLLQSLTLGGYDGLITVKELKEYGDIGIGTFDGVNGEMIVLDGVVYQALSDGNVVIADDEETVPFSDVSFMDIDIQKDLSVADINDLKEQLNAIVEENGKNHFYFVKFFGSCNQVLVRTELKQEKPYKPLDEALKTDQREFTYDNISGTIVGLYCPDYASGLNAPGWHFHFLSEDKKTGGHMLGVTSMNGTAYLDENAAFEMIFPDSDDFHSQELGQNQEDRIKSVEQ